ncbi:hypothetical protein SAMN05443245_6906 [Paraburkholderia fungorum]|uniref:Uncharacterized protein n=1 Tax=Paraburkholderia fungorum TaxID=134537 RepID=A0A1H1JN42_9BURK|nr:hypothetical protein SAMN05443245_6906 [Paraburkholderia fungorum]
MARPLSLLGRPARPSTTDDYAVSVASKSVHKGIYFGTLSVIRKTDGRVLHPFDGAPDIGPFPTFEEARNAAHAFASRLISSDLLNPED